MDKKKIIKTSIYLICIGFITKIISSIARIIMTRKIGQKAMGIYMLVTPIYIFFINIIQLSLPNIIATKIAKDPKNSQKTIITSSIISLIVNLIFMFFIFFFAPFIANNILKNSDTYKSIISLSLLIPLISLGGLLKGYYMGIGRVETSANSQIYEEIARIIFIILISKIYLNKGDSYLAYGAFLSLCAGEVFSLSYMIFKLPRLKDKKKMFLKGIKDKENYIFKDILEMSLPLTSGKLISVIAYTLEPIIMTNILLNLGYSTNYITTEYGIISGYVFPLLLLPGFFANALSRVLLHPLSKHIGKKEYKEGENLTKYICLISLSIGLIFSIILFFFNKELMILLYRNSKGYKYVKYFAFPIILYYIESPLISCLTALNKTKKILLYDTISSIIRLVLIIILLPRYNMLSIGISTIVSSSILVILMLVTTIRFFRKHNKFIININKD